MQNPLKILQRGDKVRRQYRLAWVLYGLNTLVTFVLFFLFPEDRVFLKIYLAAAVGPLIAQGFSFRLLQQKPWMPHARLIRLALLGITATLAVRGAIGNRQDLYVFLLLGMGPLLYTANVYAGLRVKELSEEPGN